MSYSILQSDTAVELIQNGAVVLSLDPTINPRLCGHLCSPAFHDGGTVQDLPNGDRVYVNALSDAGGKWVIDTVTKRFQCASATLDETAKDETTRNEVVALRAELAQELVDNMGLTLTRARWFVGFLWRFVKKANALQGVSR